MKNINDPKLLAFYLPQYHTFPENDNWWGKGFTEWTNVKKAKPLYRGHYQPQEPLNNNYYDLSIFDNMLRQMSLAKQYGVYGFCYYHYWFNGKLLMQKPLEAMRDYRGDKVDYCLCWANEPWTRAWDGKTDSILMPQYYGDQEEWESHFTYLLTYFQDNKYVKVDNKPVLVIYRCNNVPKCGEMIEYMNKRCCDEGFDGIYVIEEANTFQKEPACSSSAAYLEFEPVYTTNHDRNFWNKVCDKIYTVLFNAFLGNKCEHIYHYSWVWKKILSRSLNIQSGKKTFLGSFVTWDNTPRKGNKSIIYIGATPKKFKRYLQLQYNRAKSIDCEYIFLNAWNEWGEGAYLEPDTKNEYQYLQAIKDVFIK